MSALSSVIRSVFASVGVTVERSKYGYAADRQANIVNAGIDLVIDVGANSGQYGASLRGQNYCGAIYSLEPLPDAFAKLCERARADKSWKTLNAAAGNAAGSAKLNVSQDSVCSSLLLPTSALIDAIPTARVTKSIPVDVVRLDEIALPAYSRLMLKLDVQGFEKTALEGASGLLGKVQLLEIELGIDQGYQKGYGIVRAIPELDALGFKLVSMDRGATNTKNGRLIDVDILLARV